MAKQELKQIEADVVISLWNTTYNLGRICPFWECEEDAKGLFDLATREALAFNEDCGGGQVNFKIHDFREKDEE